MPAMTDSHKKVVRVATLSCIFVVLTAILTIAIQRLTELNAEYANYWLFPIALGILISALTTFLLSRLTEKDVVPKERDDWHYPLIAAGLAFCCMTILYLFVGMWPAGSKSAMIVDMHHQYGPLLAQLKDMLAQGDGMLYSFEVGIGTSFLPLFAYYLASPFNLLLLLFPDALLTEAILVITLLKNALAAFLFAWAIQYIYRNKNGLIPVLAVCYSLMMYFIAYSWNIMWLDGVMMLPLVIMSFERLMRTGKFLPYILSLAYVLYTNYYIGFMVCIFLVLYYAAWLLRKKRTGKQGSISFGRFALGSLLGGGLAMFLLLPTALSLGDTSAAGAALPELQSEFDLFNLLHQLMPGADPTIRSGNMPNLYCGVLAVIMLPIYATTSAIPLRRRVTMLGVLGVLTVSLSLNIPNLIWHGLHAPNDLPHRFSFLFSFMLLLLAYEALLHLDKISTKQVALSALALCVWLVLEERFTKENFKAVYIGLAIVLIYAAVLTLASRKQFSRRAFSALLALVTVTEMTLCGCYSITRLDKKEFFTNHTDYVDNVITEALDKMVARTEQIGDEAADGAFYRMEFIPRRTCVDTALFDYRGITVFASSSSYQTTRLMGGLGYAVNGVNSYLYHSFVAPVDSLLGIRYVALESNLESHAQLKLLDSVSATRTYRDGTTGDKTYYIYENADALPLAYMADSQIKKWKFSYYNPVFSQNSLYQALTNTNEKVYDIVPLSPEGSNANCSVAGDTEFFFSPDDAVGNSGMFYVTIPTEGQYFAYVDCRSAEDISIEVGNGAYYNVAPYEPYIIDLGTLSENESVNVTVNADNPASGNIYVFGLNTGVYLNDIRTLAEGGMQVTSFTDNRVNGTVTAKEDGVLFITLPYDEGWSVKVDGKEAKTFAVGDGFIGVDVAKGDHTVEMTFVPKGLMAGIVISVVSLLLTVLIAVMQYCVRRKKPVSHDMTSPFLPQETPPENGQNPLPAISLQELMRDLPEDAPPAQDEDSTVSDSETDAPPLPSDDWKRNEE